MEPPCNFECPLARVPVGVDVRHLGAIMPSEPIVPISGALSKPMERLFKAGGFALAFGFAGLFLMVFASMSGSQLRVPMFVAGSLLTFVCLAFFVYTNLKARNATRSLKEDLPLLDALQRTAYQVVEMASVTQSFAFKHLEKIQRAVEVVAPLIESLPVVGQVAKKAGLTNSVRVSAVIVAATENTKETVLRLQEAIRRGDLKEIQKYGKQLDRALSELKAALKADADA